MWMSGITSTIILYLFWDCFSPLSAKLLTSTSDIQGAILEHMRSCIFKETQEKHWLYLHEEYWVYIIIYILNNKLLSGVLITDITTCHIRSRRLDD